MYKRRDKDNKLRHEFIKGVDEFVTFSEQRPELNDGDNIRCPCVRCDNLKYLDVPNVKVHLYKKGFTPNYYVWFSHGEMFGIGSMSSPTQPNPYREMVVDAFGNNVHQSVLEEATSAEITKHDCWFKNGQVKQTHIKEHEKYTQNLSESQASGSETDPNRAFFETVGGYRKGEVVGFGKDGASLYYERGSRRPVGSAYSPSVSARLAKISKRLEDSERARAEFEERQRRREQELEERERRREQEQKKQTEYIEQMKFTMDAFMRRFGESSPFFPPAPPPNDPTNGSGASGAFVA